MSKLLNDGSSAPPRLKVYMNLGTLAGLRDDTIWPKVQGAEAMAALKAAGFEGVQDGDATLARAAGLGSAASGRVDAVGDALDRATQWKDAGHEAATLHVGTGFESDAEMDALVDAALDASAKTGFPLFIETHRATITQDIWRTIQLTDRRPDVRFNADFSHFYTGQEMVYGDLEAKWRAMQPIFDRTGFMHGRIGSPGSMQVDIGDGRSKPALATGGDFLAHHREMWTRAMHGFLKHARPGDALIFAPELLAPSIYYGRVFSQPDGTLREESDRYAQSLVYARLARECFADAERRR